MKIAIDGPAGAGKSTVARRLAGELGFVYIDTGAMYRALTWKAVQESVDIDDVDSLYALVCNTKIHFKHNSRGQRMICNNIDISEEIRSPKISSLVSRVSSYPQVRAVMVARQQKMAEVSSIIMDGRDIGEYVLPDADYKFFLTAGIEQRVKRRVEELKIRGYETDTEVIRQEIMERDRTDSNRDMGALKLLSDSIVIDTSDLTIEEVISLIKSCIQEA